MVRKEKKKNVLLVTLFLLRRNTINASTPIPITATATPIRSKRILSKKFSISIAYSIHCVVTNMVYVINKFGSFLVLNSVHCGYYTVVFV